MGFEPMIPFGGIHTFQACAIDQLGHLSNSFKTQISYSFGGAKVQNNSKNQPFMYYNSEAKTTYTPSLLPCTINIIILGAGQPPDKAFIDWFHWIRPTIPGVK